METRLGDGFYLHVQAVALNGDDARTLAALAGDSEWVKWHVKSYALGVKDGMPAFMATRPDSDEFRIGDFVALLAEIPPGGTASRLNTGMLETRSIYASRLPTGPSSASE